MVYTLHSHQQAHTLERLPLIKVTTPGDASGDIGDSSVSSGRRFDNYKSRILTDLCGRGDDTKDTRCAMRGYNIFVNAH